ncbi:MAG: hypothetical protein ACFFAS_07695 [Promethearchaeota archaeon]
MKPKALIVRYEDDVEENMDVFVRLKTGGIGHSFATSGRTEIGI